MDITPSRVIAGTTLAPASDELVTTAARIARTMGATLHLVNAYEVPLVFAGAPFDPAACMTPPTARELQCERHRALEAQAARLGLAAYGPVVLEAAAGPAHRVLGAAARREGATLVLVGAADSFAAHALGSTASRLVRSSQCPVLVVRSALLHLRSVLLPLDLSPISGEVLTAGLDLVGKMIGAACDSAARTKTAVEALFVVEPIGYEGFVPQFDLDGVKAAAQDKLRDFVGGHNPQGWRIACSAAFGGPREEILSHIAAAHPDLIVTGTHGRGGFDRFLVGSVAEAVVRACRTSVLVVPPQAAHTAGAAPGTNRPEPLPTRAA